jgi:dolichol-phosphate mannosyltransferase
VRTVYVVAPVFDEERNVPALLDGWRQLARALAPDRFVGLLVDDGSRDGTVAAIEAARGDLPVEVLLHGTNRGPGAAFGTAFEALAPRLADEDAVVTAEGDNTSRIELVGKMLGRLWREDLDLVLASPHSYGGGFTHTTGVRVLLSLFASGYVRGLLGLGGINTTSSFFRAIRGSALRALQECYGPRIVERDGFDCMVEMLIKASAMGMSISEIAMKLDTSRREGVSKMRVLRTIQSYGGLFGAHRRWVAAARRRG